MSLLRKVYYKKKYFETNSAMYCKDQNYVF